MLLDRPNLRHLKGQAKDLLVAGVAASIAEAQFQVARRYGFASWPKLKAHVDAVAAAGAALERMTSTSLVDGIMTFLAGQDLLTLADIRDALCRELDAAGPAALVQLHERLNAAPDWDFYPADPLASRVHRVLADKLLEPGSVLEGINHVHSMSGHSVVVIRNHLSYADANLIEILLRRAGGEAMADRLSAIAGPKVYSSRKRRFSSLCFATIRTPQSRVLATREAALPRREVARAARRSIDVAHERLRCGDALLVFAEGTRSRSKEMQRLLAAAARYLDGPAIWILPVSVVGTEAMFPIGTEALHRVTVGITFGQPFEARKLEASARGDRQLMMDAVGLAIAALLPALYRGAYSANRSEMTTAFRVLRESSDYTR